MNFKCICIYSYQYEHILIELLFPTYKHLIIITITFSSSLKLKHNQICFLNITNFCAYCTKNYNFVC